MCLLNAKIINSEKDIVCYKVAYDRGNGFYSSPYTNYWFALGKNINTPSIKGGNPALFSIKGEVFNGIYNTDGTLTIESGAFHSFKNKSDAIAELNYLKSFKHKKFFADFIEMQMKNDAEYACLIECRIPAGSIVFEGDYSYRTSYASNKIIFKKEINIPLKYRIKNFLEKIK